MTSVLISMKTSLRLRDMSILKSSLDGISNVISLTSWQFPKHTCARSITKANPQDNLPHKVRNKTPGNPSRLILLAFRVCIQLRYDGGAFFGYRLQGFEFDGSVGRRLLGSIVKTLRIGSCVWDLQVDSHESFLIAATCIAA